MKKKGLIIGLIVLAFVIAGIIAARIINTNSSEAISDKADEEVIELASLMKQHCFDDVCISDMIIKKSADPKETDYTLDFEMTYNGKADLNGVKLEFVFTTDEGQVKVIQPESMQIEADNAYSYSIDTVKENLKTARSYEFTYTVNNK